MLNLLFIHNVVFVWVIKNKIVPLRQNLSLTIENEEKKIISPSMFV